MKTLDYVKLGLLSAILILVFLDYRCCVRVNACCNESSQMHEMDDSVPSKIPAKTTLLPQLSATSIIVIYDFHTVGETGNADSRLEGVNVDIYQQTVDGLYDPRQHAAKTTDVNG